MDYSSSVGGHVCNNPNSYVFYQADIPTSATVHFLTIGIK